MKKKSEIIYGLRACIEAIHSGKECEKIFIKTGLKGELSKTLMSLINQQNIPFQFVPLEKLNRITNVNHQGVVAFISPIEYQRLENILPGLYEQGKTPFILLLDGITDVRNLGAIARSAECAGVDTLVIPVRGSAQITSDAIKTSAGALHKVAVCREKILKETVLFLKESGIKIISATEKSERLYTEIDLTVPVAIILGSEEKGISREVLELSDEYSSIPVFGSIASLNVSVAAGILMYEVLRQRKQ